MSHDSEHNNLPNGPKFGLPADYFEKSAASVFNKIEWLEEHKAFEVLAGVRDHEHFGVPRDYFLKTEQKLELLHCPALSLIGKQTGFLIPENYFALAEAGITGMLSDVEPVLSFTGREQHFKVEGSYFSENKQQLEKLLLKENKPGRVIPLFSKRTIAAVAAVFVVMLGLWLYNAFVVPAQVKDCGAIACIDKAELLKSNSLESLDNDELYELVNTRQLEQTLEKKSGEASKDPSPDSLADESDDFTDEI